MYFWLSLNHQLILYLSSLRIAELCSCFPSWWTIHFPSWWPSNMMSPGWARPRILPWHNRARRGYRSAYPEGVPRFLGVCRNDRAQINLKLMCYRSLRCICLYWFLTVFCLFPQRMFALSPWYSITWQWGAFNYMCELNVQSLFKWDSGSRSSNTSVFC